MMPKLFIALVCLTFIFTTAGPNSGATITTALYVDSNRDWSNASNVASSNDTYATIAAVQTDDFSYYIKVTNFGFSIPGGATVDGIKVEWERYSDAQVFVEDDLSATSERVVKGGTITGTNLATGTTWPSSDTYQAYGGATELWGLSWSASDINASTFGAAGCVFNAGNNALTTAYVDHCRITIYYTEAASNVKKKVIGYGGHTEIERL